MGRAGRGGDQSVCVFLRKKGERTPPEMRQFLQSDSTRCLKQGMLDIFTLSNPDSKIEVHLAYMQWVEDQQWLFCCSFLCQRGREHWLQCILHHCWVVPMHFVPVGDYSTTWDWNLSASGVAQNARRAARTVHWRQNLNPISSWHACWVWETAATSKFCQLSGQNFHLLPINQVGWIHHEEKVRLIHLEATGCFLDTNAGELPDTSHVSSPHGRQGKAWRQYRWQGERQPRHQGHSPAPGERRWTWGGGRGKQWQWHICFQWPWTNLRCYPVGRTTLKIGMVLFFSFWGCEFTCCHFTYILPQCLVSFPLLMMLVDCILWTNLVRKVFGKIYSVQI